MVLVQERPVCQVQKSSADSFAQTGLVRHCGRFELCKFPAPETTQETFCAKPPPTQGDGTSQTTFEQRRMVSLSFFN
jgi:hypothetical protein